MVITLIYSESNNWGEIYTDSYREQQAKEYAKFIESKFIKIPSVKNYFNYRLHDSWVTNTQFNKEQLEITLNDFSTHCFVDALLEVSKQKIPYKKRVLPVSFSFKKLKKLSVAWINKNDKLIYLKKDKYLPQLKEYLFEQVISVKPGQITVGALFWSGLKGNKSELLVEIECEELFIDEQQRNAFIKLFGGNHLEIYDLYVAQKQNGAYFDFSTSLEFIEKQFAKR